MKKLIIILLSALSLAMVAQEKKTITIQQPKCDDAAIANVLKTSLTEALVNSEEWEPVETGGQCILIIEVCPIGDSCFISCKILDVESALAFAYANEQCKLKLKKIQKVCKSLAKQLLEKQQ